jgi:hypothetical protein
MTARQMRRQPSTFTREACFATLKQSNFDIAIGEFLLDLLWALPA